MKGLYSLRWTGMWFEETTWKQIGLYIYDRKSSSKLVTWWEQANIDALAKLWLEEKANKEIALQASLGSTFNDPKFKKFLEEKWILINNKLDIDGKLKKLKEEKVSIKGIESYFNWLGGRLLNEAEMIMKQSKEFAKEKQFDKKSLSSLWISWILSKDGKDGKTSDISGRLIAELNLQECKDATIGLDTWVTKLDKSAPDYKEKVQLISDIKEFLKSKILAFQKQADAQQANITGKKAWEDAKKWVTGEKFEAPDQKVLDAAADIGTARFQQESTKESLREYGITSLEQAEKKLNSLNGKTNLTQEELYLKKLLEQFIRDNIGVARELSLAEKTLWTEYARDIFTSSNQFISKDFKEKYNFDHLSEIAMRTDPESTPGEKELARLKPWESLSMESFIEDGNGNNSAYDVPEISNCNIVKGSNGIYSIDWVSEARNLTKEVLKEYVETIRLYAEIWLSQFIPHIALISGELQKQWVSTKLDGHSDAMEQQKLLKSLFKMLFGKEIITSSLWNVKQAFSSALGNPTNPRNSMQEILREKHHLIRESNWRIDWEVLKNWMQSKKETDPQDILLKL